MREAYANFKELCMLWSIGKDSTVMLWLARKAFYGHVPFPSFMSTRIIKSGMIEYRDRLAREWRIDMIYGENRAALMRRRHSRMASSIISSAAANSRQKSGSHSPATGPVIA